MTTLQPPPISLLDKYHGADFLPLYTATVRVSGGELKHARASGAVQSDDGMLDVSLRLPTELGGHGDGTNPEQLFAASYAACFHGALRLLASRAKVDFADAVVTASVTFGRDPVDGLFTLVTDVRISLVGVERAVAEELIRNTERICPYAKMAREGIECRVSLA